MKRFIQKAKKLSMLPAYFILCLLFQGTQVFAQEDSTASAVKEEEVPAKAKPVKNTFESVWIIDNQTVMVPVKGTMEMDIMHRFGTVNNGYDDFWGFFAPSNIRLGISYAPVKKLFVGVGITKSNMLLDANAKYSFITQTPGKYPVSVSYYANMAFDSRKNTDGGLFKYNSQKFSFFNQLIIARKVTKKLSLQVAPSISHQNSVNGYYTKNDSTGQTIFKEMLHDHFAIAFSGRYKLTPVTSIMVNYDQPLTKHNTQNPDPNLSFGFEFNTSNHSFQLFLGNYFFINPQRNNMFNQNSPFGYDDLTKTHPGRKDDNPATPEDESIRVKGGRFLIGFNITRLWNY
jgi:hypothetical protein